jgi:glycosyltransferase involved in cell wall biosynthesis
MLSAIVIAKDEEKNIGACLESLAFADETVVLVDAESRDNTRAVAEASGARVFVQEWKGYAETKQIAVSKASGGWILWVDADERVTPELAEEIRRTLAGRPDRAAYRVKRKAFFLGKWIRHGGWYPGRVARLFKKDKGRFNGAEVHEGLVVEGGTGDLNSALLHYTDDSLEQYFRKFNAYTGLAALDMSRRGKAFKTADLFFRPFHMFLKMYVFQLGFLDGMEGFVLAVLSAQYAMVKYAKLWELRRAS